jgi:hypothetical protein
VSTRARKTADAGTAANDHGHDSHLPLAEILSALMMESVRSRLRHRALLEILSSEGKLDLHQYIEVYRREEELDFHPLADMLFLPREDFMKAHGEWLEHDQKKFGFSTRERPAIALTPATHDAADEPSNTERSRATVKRRRSKS